MSRLPQYFACGVDIVGPSNLVTLAKSVPPTWRSMMAAWVGDPDTEADFLLSRSPITYADQIVAPLFVIQGANDPRVNKAESDGIVDGTARPRRRGALRRLRRRGPRLHPQGERGQGHGRLGRVPDRAPDEVAASPGRRRIATLARPPSHPRPAGSARRCDRRRSRSSCRPSQLRTVRGTIRRPPGAGISTEAAGRGHPGVRGYADPALRRRVARSRRSDVRTRDRSGPDGDHARGARGDRRAADRPRRRRTCPPGHREALQIGQAAPPRRAPGARGRGRQRGDRGDRDRCAGPDRRRDRRHPAGHRRPRDRPPAR